MDWKEIDERIVRRGELILDSSLLKDHKKELETMNKHRIECSYILVNSYVQLLTAAR